MPPPHKISPNVPENGCYKTKLRKLSDSTSGETKHGQKS